MVDKYVKLTWPESQKFMEYEECYAVSNGEENGIMFVPEDLYYEIIEDSAFPRKFDTNLGEIICNKDYAVVEGWSDFFYYVRNPKKGDILLLYVIDSDEWRISKCTGSAPGFPLLVEDSTLLIGINCELIGSYDPDKSF